MNKTTRSISSEVSRDVYPKFCLNNPSFLSNFFYQNLKWHQSLNAKYALVMSSYIILNLTLKLTKMRLLKLDFCGKFYDVVKEIIYILLKYSMGETCILIIK